MSPFKNKAKPKNIFAVISASLIYSPASCTLTEADWQLATHFVSLLKMTSSLCLCWHRTEQPHISVCQGDCTSKTCVKFLLRSKSPACEGVVVVVGGHKCACVWRSRRRVLGEGRRGIVLPPCPPQATEDLIWQLQGGTWKDQNKSRSPPTPFFPLFFFFLNPLPFLYGGEKTNPSHRPVVAGFGSLSVQGGGSRQAVWMHIMTTIEQTSTVQPWKPSGRGWEFQGWR